MEKETSNGTWRLLQSGPCPPDYNMALDEALLQSGPQLAGPVLRFYGWTEPAATFGYSQRYADIERVTLLRPLVRRPTGGGLVPHDADWTYSLVFPARHPWFGLKAVESYKRVHEWIRDAFARIGVTASLAPCAQKEIPGQCFIGAEQSDLLWHGRKIAGAAQRRTRQGLLIQGSIQPPSIPVSRSDWQSAMCQIAAGQMTVQWAPFEPQSPLVALTDSLRQSKYSQPAYNQRR